LPAQVFSRDLVDVRIVEHRTEGATEPLYVLWVGRDEYGQVFGGSHDPMQVQGDTPHDLVPDLLPL
jgi:hypothetical protein